MGTLVTAHRTNAPGRTTRKSPSRYFTSASPGICEGPLKRLSTFSLRSGPRTPYSKWSGAATQNIMVQLAALNPTIGATMRHLTGLIFAAAVALPGATRADAPKPEQGEITHSGRKCKGFLYRPEGNGPFAAVVALHDCHGLAGRRTAFGRRYRD